MTDYMIFIEDSSIYVADQEYLRVSAYVTVNVDTLLRQRRQITVYVANLEFFCGFSSK